MLPGKKFFISLGIALVIGNIIDFNKQQIRGEMMTHGCALHSSDVLKCRSAMRIADKDFYDESWISESLYWLIIIRLLVSVLDNQKPTNNKDDYLDKY